ncbi:MAG: helix-turn-helix domain-containing protein [bacterium]|nr:helix-turn-helix domain-containing protein [bacterium]
MHDIPHNRADAVRNRALLLDTARRLFAEKGVENVPMSAVAEAAGVGKGTLYRHFPKGKGELCETLIDQDQRDLQERTFAQLRTLPDPAAMLRWYVIEVAAFVERNLLFLTAGSGEFLMHPAHGWWWQTIRGLLARIDFSHKPTPPDLDYMTDALYILLDVRTIRFQREGRGWSLQRIQDGLLTLIDTLID